MAAMSGVYMIIPDDVQKCVGFLGYQKADGSYQMAGSVFFIGYEVEDGGARSVFAVTAKHVIDGIRNLGLDKVWFRLNIKNGQSEWFDTRIDQWFFHPTDQEIDVAILGIVLVEKLDHLAIPNTLFIDDEKLKDNEIGLGDEVFIIGLFRHHHGSQRNIPIVRVGNLACLSEEKITTGIGKIDAHLIECRSIGGLSGSPVFLNLGATRMIEGQIRHAVSRPVFYLMGLIHGHYDVSSSLIDKVKPDETGGLTPQQVNTGIAIVVPFHKISEVVEAFKAEALAASRAGGRLG